MNIMDKSFLQLKAEEFSKCVNDISLALSNDKDFKKSFFDLVSAFNSFEKRVINRKYVFKWRKK